MYRKFQLDNGLRIVSESIPTLRSVTVGIWVDVGSRDEVVGEEGLSHFLEHMFFKGTRTRTARDISHEMDALGGEMNAFTGRETTTFYVKVLDQHLEQALTLLADLFHRSRFPTRELEKEKQVVLEEIRTVQDDPEDLLQDLHAEQVMRRHPLGRPILGKPETVSSWRRKDLLRYVGTHYDPRRTIISIAGNFQERSLRKMMEKLFGGFRANGHTRAARQAPSVSGGTLVRHKQLEQVHVCIGLQGVGASDPNRYAAHVLNTILGGSVSSRLFQEVREKRGLAYSIYSYLSTYSDAGTMTIYAGTRSQEAGRVVEVVCRALRRLQRDGITKAELTLAKNHLKGSLMLGLESSHGRMSKLAKDELYLGAPVSLNDMVARIDAVSAPQVHTLTARLFDERSRSVTALGPVHERTITSAIH
ncbi:MAG: pitrilysin family protein [Nitrospiraceae bacterium]